MADKETRQYDPLNVVFNFGGIDISGFAEGTFIEAEREVDAWTTVVGSDGEVTRVKSQNRSGTYKLTLQGASPSNAYLSTLATQDEETSNGVRAVLLTDKNGSGPNNTFSQAKQAWIKKKPKVPFANTAENREWVIATGNMQLNVGGQNLAGA